MWRHLWFLNSLKRCQEPEKKNNSKEKYVTLEGHRMRKGREREGERKQQSKGNTGTSPE